MRIFSSALWIFVSKIWSIESYLDMLIQDKDITENFLTVVFMIFFHISGISGGLSMDLRSIYEAA
jgi:hypothetical protein